VVHQFVRVLQVGVSLFALSGVAHAQADNYPVKPIRFVLAPTAGSAADVLARTVGQKLSASWGQQVVVENRPSAGGIIAAKLAASATPDGYTLLMVSALHASAAAMFKSLPYDPVKDFAGITRVANVPSVLVVSSGMGIKSMKQFIAAARARPGEFNYSSPGIGTASHLAGAYFNNMAGVQAQHVPYKGIPEAVTDVVTGRVQYSFVPIPNAIASIKDGKLIALATSTGKRASVLPELPTVAEAGLAGYEFDPWFAMFTSAGVPRPLVNKLSQEVGRILVLPDVKEKLQSLGAEPMPTTPEQLDAHVRAEIVKYRKIVKDAGIKPEA
jgi:tripartite-type tricarboxylate transporter receptor subunit TctC